MPGMLGSEVEVKLTTVAADVPAFTTVCCTVSAVYAGTVVIGIPSCYCTAVPVLLTVYRPAAKAPFVLP